MANATWVRMEIRGNVAPNIRRAGKWAWQVFEALVRIAKEESEGGFVADNRCDGYELAFWSNLTNLVPEVELEEARDRLVDNGLLERVDGGIQFSKWHRYQPDTTSRERKRRQRERERAVTVSPEESRGVPLGHGESRGVTDVTRDHRDERDVTVVTEGHGCHDTKPNQTKPNQTVEDRDAPAHDAPAREGPSDGPTSPDKPAPSARLQTEQAKQVVERWNQRSGQSLKGKGFHTAARARIREHGLEDVLRVVDWWWAPNTETARFLRGETDRGTRAYGLDTLLRQSKFPKYLEESKAPQRAHPKDFDPRTYDYKAAFERERAERERMGLNTPVTEADYKEFDV